MSIVLIIYLAFIKHFVAEKVMMSNILYVYDHIADDITHDILTTRVE